MALNTPPPTSIAEVKERTEICIYFPSGPSWLFQGELFTFTFFNLIVILLWRETWFVTQKDGNRLSVFGKKVPKEEI
jgi:hypothetical protein